MTVHMKKQKSSRIIFFGSCEFSSSKQKMNQRLCIWFTCIDLKQFSQDFISRFSLQGSSIRHIITFQSESEMVFYVSMNPHNGIIMRFWQYCDNTWYFNLNNVINRSNSADEGRNDFIQRNSQQQTQILLKERDLIQRMKLLTYKSLLL